MVSFKALSEICAKFEEQSRAISGGVFTAKSGESSENVIAKRLAELSLFTSKYRLLHAKEPAQTPQITERVHQGADLLHDYKESAQKLVLEDAIVKCLTQSRAVQTLISTLNHKLDPEDLEKKEKILASLEKFRALETALRDLDALHRERREQLLQLREQWHTELIEMQDMQAAAMPENNTEAGPLYQKLNILVDKMQISQWLLGKLVTARNTQYDWLSDPHKRIAVLPLTREEFSVAMFTDDD